MIFASSEVVGYAENGLRKGGSLVTAQFLNVDSDTEISLSMFKPIGDGVAGEVVVQKLTSGGTTAESYYWLADDEELPDGWYDYYTDDPRNSVTLKAGEALWVQGGNAEQSLQTSGAVGKNSITVQLRKGGTLVGNAFPMSLTLEKFIPTGDGVAGEVVVQKLTSGGTTAESYYWLADDEDLPDGWYDYYTDDPKNDLEVKSGEGLWVQGGSIDQYITIVAPIF